MRDDNEGRYATVKAAEIALLSSTVRRDGQRLSALLHPEFAEIGRSGQRWTHQDTIEALSAEESREAPETAEWLFNDIAPGIVLVNYRIHTPECDSRHSSIWELAAGGPVLRFHQGTVIPSR
jgi:ribonuclease HI